MKKIIYGAATIFFLFSVHFVTAAYSTVYYLDCNLTSDCNTGNYSKTNRNCTGSDGNAYKSISPLNSILTAGDTLYVRGGAYTNQSYDPSNSGTSSSPITIIKYSSETPTFTRALNFSLSKNYHIIDGLTFDSLTTIGGAHIRITGMYNQIRNSTFSNLGNDYAPITIGGLVGNSYEGYNTIYNCTIGAIGSKAADSGHHISIGYYLNKSHHNIIDSCTLSDAGAYGIVIYGGSTYNQVKNCIIDQTNGGLGITINDNLHSGISAHNLIDNNIIKNYGNGTPNVKAGIQLYGDSNSIRRNRIYNGGNHGRGVELSGWSKNNLIYNNTFYKNDVGGAVVMGKGDIAGQVAGNKFYNNIMYGNMHNPDVANGYVVGNQIEWTYGGKTFTNGIYGNVFDYNYIQYATGSPPLTPQTNYNSTSQWDNPQVQRPLSGVTGYQIVYPTTFPGHNFENAAGPKFVSEAEYNFSLASDSPCVNVGKVVNDADWGNLPYNGSAPDVGALESNFDSRSFSSPSPPSPPKNLRVAP